MNEANIDLYSLYVLEGLFSELRIVLILCLAAFLCIGRGLRASVHKRPITSFDGVCPSSVTLAYRNGPARTSP